MVLGAKLLKFRYKEMEENPSVNFLLPFPHAKKSVLTHQEGHGGPSTWEAGRGDPYEFKVGEGYKVRPTQNKRETPLILHKQFHKEVLQLTN